MMSFIGKYHDRLAARRVYWVKPVTVAFRIGTPWFGGIRWRVPRLDRISWGDRIVWYNRRVAQEYREAAVRAGRAYIMDWIDKCATCGKKRPLTLVMGKMVCNPCWREFRGLPPKPEKDVVQ